MDLPTYIKKNAYWGLMGLLILVATQALWAQEGIAIRGTEVATPFQINGHRLWVYTLKGSRSAVLSFPRDHSGQKLYRYRKSMQDQEEVSGATLVGNSWEVSNPETDCAYFLHPAQGMYRYFWITDYSKYDISQHEIRITPSDDGCQEILLTFSPSVPTIELFSSDGKAHEVAREIALEYPNLQFDPDLQRLVPMHEERVASTFVNGALVLPAPLTDAQVTWLGDRFMREFKLSVRHPQSNRLDGKRVAVHASYQVEDTPDGTPFPASLSAPSAVICKMIINEPIATHAVWRVVEGFPYRPNAPIVMQQSGVEARFVFDKAGTYTIVPMASNDKGGCLELGDTQAVHVGESKLEVPNAFSPFSSAGVNDVFRVSHYSLVRFEGVIFDEWGVELFRWTDPDKGWDGTFRGKPVAPGVYYYMIAALGSDDKSYDLRGDINIIGTRHEIANPSH